MLPIEANEGVNTPNAFVEGVTLHVPPIGNADKLKEAAFEQNAETGTMVGVVGVFIVIVTVFVVGQLVASVGVTTTV